MMARWQTGASSPVVLPSALPLLGLCVLLCGCSNAPLPSLQGEAGGVAAGAGAGGLSPGMVTSYGSSNAFLTTGYSDKELGPDHYEVRAKGSSVTPITRLEKIALARAAEIGKELKFAYFKTGGFAHGVVCQEARDFGPKSGKTLAETSPTVGLDVVYAKVAGDASYLPTSDTFDRLTRELGDEVVSPEAKAQAKVAAAARCGK